MKKFAALVIVLGCGTTAVSAQVWNRVSGYAGGGFTNPLGDTSNRANRGWNIVAGIGPRLAENFGLIADFSYQQSDLNRLGNITPTGPLDADLRVWSLTLNPTVEIGTLGPVGAYATGGYGLYNRRVRLTQADVGTDTFCDPFYGFCFDALVPVDRILGQRDTYKGGFNVGGGITFGTANAKFFAEVRYHRMFTRDIRTEMLPVSFGVRW